VSIDAAAAGFPVAFMSTDASVISGSCGTTVANLVVTTFNSSQPGGVLTNEHWYGFFY
jgi:hypothetical protein